MIDHEVVLVDNGSEDDSVPFVRACFPHVRVISLPFNLGFAAAMNAGARAARSEYLAFLNNDAAADPNWLGELTGCIQRHPRAASVTSKILKLDRRDILDDAGNVMTRSLKAYHRGRGEFDRGQYEDESEVFSASGAASMWRARALVELGLFDEDFFAYYEDVDLGFRARLAGYECWYAPRAVVFHAGGATSRARQSEFVFFYSVRNRWRMIVKNVPGRLFVRNAHRIFLGELLTFGRSMREGHMRLTLAAYRDVLRSLRPLLAKRRGIQAMKSIQDKDLNHCMTSRHLRSKRRHVRVFQ
jgi:GT2 family glycosyltransferase